MSEKLGPLRYNENQQEVFLGHAITQRQNMSEETARVIDEEIRRIVTQGLHKAREVLNGNREKLEAITQALMEYETVSGDEVQALLRGEKIVRVAEDEETKGPAGPAVPVAGKMRGPRPEPGSGGLEPQPQT
jgi:cell division protease FtsH